MSVRRDPGVWAPVSTSLVAFTVPALQDTGTITVPVQQVQWYRYSHCSYPTGYRYSHSTQVTVPVQQDTGTLTVPVLQDTGTGTLFRIWEATTSGSERRMYIINTVILLFFPGAGPGREIRSGQGRGPVFSWSNGSFEPKIFLGFPAQGPWSGSGFIFKIAAL